ncbi:MAG: transcriptional repressor [Planctomycetota bacterium]|nr:transcriptional repressor [Planctomycetota bacterium]
MVARLEAAFQELCKKNRWRRTAQRRAVVEYLFGNTDHPTVEAAWMELRKKLPELSLDSVYRILDELAEAGHIRRFENCRVIRYDPETKPHGHFFCRRCGRMYDFFTDAADGAGEACAELGDVSTVELHVNGICNACLRTEGG